MATTTTQNYLGRCKWDGCGYVIFATAEDVQDAEDFRDVTAGTGVYRVGNNGCFARCTNRHENGVPHKVFPCKPVKGTYSEDHKCDARCLNTKGWDCTCSCGGADHGRGHVATVVQAADLPPLSTMSNEALVAFIKDTSDTPHTVEDYVPRVAPATPVRKHLGEVGQTIRGEVFVKTVKSLANGSTLYVFTTTSNGDIVKWFVPGHADPDFESGATLTIRAKVKAHSEFNGTPETVVIYVEEVK